jgi:hypothetical protein
MHRTWLITFFAAVLLAEPTVAANENTTIVLHAQPIGDIVNCEQWIGNVDCSPGLPPTVNVGSGEHLLVYLFLRNYEGVTAFFCRWAVDGGTGPKTWGDWTFWAAGLGCLPGQHGDGPWPYNGNMQTAFNCISGGALRVLGYLILTSGSRGCLGIEEHDTTGTGVFDCSDGIEVTPIVPQNRGRICVGAGGYNACDPRVVSVESATWGRIKRQYQ